ncbi:MAG: prepilin peptidase [Acidimicrobiales bacterium]
MDPATRAVALVLSATAGLAIGSFLNVVAYRVPRHLSLVRPASHCPACNVAIGGFDNIPVLSWIVLGGRCRHCRGAISPRYPLIEMTTGLLFVLIAAGSSTLGSLAPLDVVVATSVAVLAIDLEGADVPAALGVCAAVAGASLVVVSVATGTPSRLAWAAGAAALALGAWAINRLVQGPHDRAFPSAAACAAWGWTAGWVSDAGGLTFGVALCALALFVSCAPRVRIPPAAVGSAIAIVTIAAGMLAAL